MSNEAGEVIASHIIQGYAKGDGQNGHVNLSQALSSGMTPANCYLGGHSKSSMEDDGQTWWSWKLRQ